MSPDEEYGSLTLDDPPFTETISYAPKSPYAANKAASDHLVRAYYKNLWPADHHQQMLQQLRPFSVPRKTDPADDHQHPDRKPIPVYGDGRQIRDCLYVDDQNLGVGLILSKGRPGKAYNIGGSNEHTNLETVHLICDLIHDTFSTDPRLAAQYPDCLCTRGIHPDTLITHVTDRKGHDRIYAIDATKIQTELDFTPKETFEFGLQKTLNWYLTQKLKT